MRLTDAQYRILRDMENGEVVRHKVFNMAASLHRLVAAGVLDYVEMKTGNYQDDIFRLTARGRDMMGLPPS